MSKKKRSRTQQLLEQKRQLQQQISSTRNEPALIGRKEEVQIVGASPAKDAAPQLIERQSTGMRRTLVSSLIITVLLVGVYVANDRTEYIKDMGKTIYTSLQLSN